MKSLFQLFGLSCPFQIISLRFNSNNLCVAAVLSMLTSVVRLSLRPQHEYNGSFEVIHVCKYYESR